MNHKAAHAIGSDELSEAMDEMKEAMNGVMESATHMVKSVDWKAMAPKVLAGAMLLYSVRNRKFAGVVSSILVAAASNYLSNRMETSKVRVHKD